MVENKILELLGSGLFEKAQIDPTEQKEDQQLPEYDEKEQIEIQSENVEFSSRRKHTSRESR